jgi:hypothetical protein
MPKKRTTKTATKRAKSPIKKRAMDRNKDIVESQVAAATRIGCPVEHVKLAKSLGSTAFMQGNRISIEKLTDYFKTPEFQNALQSSLEDTTASDWDKRLKRAKALQAEHELKIKQGKSWDAETAKRLFAAGDTAMTETLRRYLESEQPPLIEGKSAAEILKVNRKFLDDLIADLTASRVAAVESMAEDLPDEGEEDR